MKLVNLHYCEIGSHLATPVYDKITKRILLNKGVRLTKPTIESLLKKGFVHVYIDTDYGKGVYLSHAVSVETRTEVSHKFQKIVQLVSKEHALYKKANAATHEKMIREFNIVYKRLIREVTRSKHLLEMLTNLQSNKDEQLFEHCLNTSIYSLAIASKLNVKDEQLYSLGLGALLHDIGLTLLPTELQNKSNLTDKEREEFNKHPALGYELLRKYGDISLLSAHCAYQLHENYDGSGFPRGLKGNDIHLFPRIVAVADMFDSLIRGVGGNKPLLPHEAMEVLNGYCYTRFDPKVLEAFRAAIAIYPVGLTIKLNTGETASVISNNITAPQRPVVRILTNRNGESLDKHYDLDLSHKNHLSIMITECEPIY